MKSKHDVLFRPTFGRAVGSSSENKRLRSPCEPKNALAVKKNHRLVNILESGKCVFY